MARLDAKMHLPLTLVSAPAGYGKSTLISDWLDSHPGPSAWLSLGEAENDPLTLLSYVVSAVQGVFPDACDETRALLEASTPPPITEIATSLVNELDHLEAAFVLVLDDFHVINNPDVHDELLSLLLQHLPRALHLVIITRMDPPLPLGKLRAQHLLSEIRVRDLEFDEAETGAFLRQATGRPISDRAVARVFEQVEGWPVGLRLTALALEHESDPEAFLENFDGDLNQVREFLLEEVLSQQTPEYRDCMRKTSILGRFCAPLSVALCEAPCATDESGTCQTFVEYLDERGMLCIPLDEKKKWYRYHHLFQELLYDQLKDNSSPKEIAALHRRAARWFEENGCLDEAFDHVLRGDGPVAAAGLIARHRNLILNQEQWQLLDRWLKALPADVRDSDPELLMLEAWHSQNRGRYPRAYEMADRIEELLADRACEPREKSCNVERLRGGINALRTAKAFNEGDAKAAIEHGGRALQELPANCLSERGFASVNRNGALQISGRAREARDSIHALLADASVPVGTYQARLLMSLCFTEWMEGDLLGLLRASRECLAIGVKAGLPEATLLGRYFLGQALYHRNELSEARVTLMSIEGPGEVANLEYWTEATFVLASVEEAFGQADKAKKRANALSEHMLRIHNSDRLQRAQAYEAELALRRGHTAAALAWAASFDRGPFTPQSGFFEPQLTLAKVWIGEGSEASLGRAASLLGRLEEFFEQVHGRRFLIETLAVRALLYDAQGQKDAARDALGRSIRLALPSNFIRLFVDLGPALARLLHGLEADEEAQQYLERILSAFPMDRESQPGASPEQRSMRRSTPPQPLAAVLTNRELDILGLLSERLSRQEIADRLCISTATVKRHAENLYSKFGVSGRRQAVTKATELGILGARDLSSEL